jgi:16S rRNA (guanine527-N7)-methyltransferase
MSLVSTDEIARGAAALGVPLEAAAAERLGWLVEELLRWNRRINLVGPCDAGTAIDRHVHDGLGLLRLLDRPEVRARTTEWLDVGSGAGLPGLVLAVARPELTLRLVEPNGKRIAFTRHAVAGLELRNVTVEQLRVEQLPERASAGALSRATFAPARWAEVGRRVVGPDGLVLVAMGGDTADPDLLDQAWAVDRFTLPRSGAGRTNVVLDRALVTSPAGP